MELYLYFLSSLLSFCVAACFTRKFYTGSYFVRPVHRIRHWTGQKSLDGKRTDVEYTTIEWKRKK